MVEAEVAGEEAAVFNADNVEHDDDGVGGYTLCCSVSRAGGGKTKGSRTKLFAVIEGDSIK